jgi:hypothetical protein
MYSKEIDLKTKNLNEVSFYFFFLIGLIHILSGLLLTNNYFVKTSWIINRSLDIPFLIASLIYIYSNIKLHTLQNKSYSKQFDFFIITLFSLISTIAFLADLIFSNKLPL